MVGKGFNYKGVISIVLVAVVWQIISFFTKPYLFPPLNKIGDDLLAIVQSWDLAEHALATMGRILIGFITAFLVGTAIGLIMAKDRTIEDFIRPVLNFVQGIPALSWVVFAVIWFKDVEIRIFFIIVITALPNFSLQAFDSYQSISKDLKEMLLVLRPKGMQLFRMLILPSLMPDLLTAWKVNLGNSTRVAIVAELVGATLGVGYQLSSAQSLFDMSKAMAWTLVLVIFILVVQFIISMFEKMLLSWRPKTER